MTKQRIVGLLIALVVLAALILWPSDRRSPPNVVLTLVGVTNRPSGVPVATCKMLNRGDRTVLYSACGDVPKYRGVAKTHAGDIKLSGIRFTGGPAHLP